MKADRGKLENEAPKALHQAGVPHRCRVSTVFLMAAFLGLNVTLNLMNKWALSTYGFRFPILLTACHMAFSFTALLPLMLSKPVKYKHIATLKNQWLGLLTAGILMAANVALNNLSLVGLSLSLNQIIRAAMPLFTVCLAVCIERKHPSRQEAFSLLVLSLGVIMAVWQDGTSGSFVPVLLCSAATVCNAAMSCFTGRLMSEKLDVLQFTFYVAPVSCITLLPFYILLEHQAFAAYLKANPSPAAAVMLTTSVVALVYNVLHSGLIHRTSAVTVTVLGELKICGILLLSAWLLGERLFCILHVAVGMVLALIGFFGYSHARISVRGHWRRANSSAKLTQCYSGEHLSTKQQLLSDS